MPKIVAPTLFRSACSIAAVLVLLGCRVVAAPAPYEEYNLARTAVRAAQDADSARFSAPNWNKAEENFRLGEKAYKDTDFEAAKKHFLLAVQFAERAETATRIKKFQTGESFP